MNGEEERKILEDFVSYLQDVCALVEQKHIDAFLREKNQAKEEKILDWNRVADGVLVVSETSIAPFLLKKERHLNRRGLRLDTEHWNVWHGGDCPFGQPEAIWMEAELRNGAIRRDQAAHLFWGRERAEGDVLNYRVIGLSPGWKYPE